ncbi:putative AAA family ATPase [Xylariomycetidae sp. FL2044]|nr:putative AAA family ATPase [Xylariomycetidae sp. FL2044]
MTCGSAETGRGQELRLSGPDVYLSAYTRRPPTDPPSSGLSQQLGKMSSSSIDDNTSMAESQQHGILEYSDVAELDSDISSGTEDEANYDEEASGHLCKVKVLYEGKSECTCCINWVDEKPDAMKVSADGDGASKDHALLVRYGNSHEEGRRMALHSIVVQSPYLRSLLVELFKGWQGITTSLKRLVFRAPFDCFYHEWDRLEDLIRDIEDPIQKKHASLLRKTLKSELKETISVGKDLARNNVITMDYLWTIFKPGMDIFTSVDGIDTINRLLYTHRSQPNLRDGPKGDMILSLHQIDFNGHEFGFVNTSVTIDEFQGTKEITGLTAFPATLHPQYEKVKNALTERGRMFGEIFLKEYHYAAYSGVTMEGHHKRHVDGRVMVDAKGYHNMNGCPFSVGTLDSTILKPRVDGHRIPVPMHDAPGRVMGYPPPPPLPQPVRPNVPGMVPTRPRGKIRTQPKQKRPDLRDELLYLCSPEVKGYCFKTKKWVRFLVSGIKEIRWNEDAFDSLVLMGEYKKLIMAFVESHVENKEAFDDVIEGKGQGIIMLLEGPPGVGKTLTAEAVADKLRRPLYTMSAGELGRNAEAVEDNLEMILEVAAKWDAVLLLDESDVFLERRGADELDRNSIVAIFLRLLEYYRGVLFMTTNRVEAIDSAFQSRIHLTVQYPPLDADARRQVWTRFIQRSCRDNLLEPADYAELAEVEVNGREIKNMIKTAQLLARHEKAPLEMEHLRTVMRVAKAGRRQL